MSIILFAMIGSMIHAGTLYWFVWLIYVLLKIARALSNDLGK